MAAIGKPVQVVLILLSVLMGCTIVLLSILLAVSRGQPAPLRDATGKVIVGSISEKIWIEVNGSKQGMFIKSRDTANPVLLFLHGGTGMPEYFLTQNYPTGLEDYFTVCWWDRRGAGLSYAPDAPPEAMTIEQYVEDTLEVTNYLRQRFHKDRIFLMAHSGGSIIAIQAASRAPELYSAYIGEAQITYQLKSEVLTYQYMVQRYRASGNERMARQLEATPPTMAVPLPAGYMRLRDKTMHELGIGTTHDMKSVMTGVFLASWMCRDYTIGEKINIWRGKFASDQRLWDRIISVDWTKVVTRLSVPTYFFHGRHDYTVSYSQAKAYLKALAAPEKGFYTFQDSAHSPMFEEPAKMRQIMEHDVFGGSISLADDM